MITVKVTQEYDIPEESFFCKGCGSYGLSGIGDPKCTAFNEPLDYNKARGMYIKCEPCVLEVLKYLSEEE